MRSRRSPWSSMDDSVTVPPVPHAFLSSCASSSRNRNKSNGVLYDFGAAYRVAGRNEEAVGLLSEACNMDPSLESGWAQLAVTYEQTGDMEKAAAAWRKAAALEQRTPDPDARARRTRVMLQRASGLESARPLK